MHNFSLLNFHYSYFALSGGLEAVEAHAAVRGDVGMWTCSQVASFLFEQRKKFSKNKLSLEVAGRMARFGSNFHSTAPSSFLYPFKVNPLAFVYQRKDKYLDFFQFPLNLRSIVSRRLRKEAQHSFPSRAFIFSFYLNWRCKKKGWKKEWR